MIIPVEEDSKSLIKIRELECRIKHLQKMLEEISELASWHYDEDADPDDTQPDDMTAHVNGLIIQIADKDGALWN